MSIEHITKVIAELFVAYEDSIDISEAKSIDDDAAEALAQHKGEICDQDPAKWADSLRKS